MRTKHLFSKLNSIFNGTVTANAEDPESKTSASSQTSSEDSFSGDDEMLQIEQDVINSLHAEVTQSGEHEYYVTMQGGNFYFSFKNFLLNINYFNFYNVSYEDRLLALSVADEINNQSMVWTVTTREVAGEENTPITISLSQTIHIHNDLHHTINYIRLLIESSFQLAGRFVTRFREVKANVPSLETNLIEKSYINRLEYTKRLVEINSWKNENLSKGFENETPFSATSLREYFKDGHLGQLSSITILMGEQVTEITNADSLQHFDIKEYLCEHYKTCPPDRMTLIFAYEKEDLTVSLRKLDGSNDRIVFYSLAAIRTGVDVDVNTQRQCITFIRSNIEIRLTSEREDYWEGKYNIEEVLEKYRAHENSEFTFEQVEFLEQASPDIDQDIYWGMRYHNAGMFYQSLFHFRRVYDNVMRTGGYKMYNDEFINTLAYYLGVAYYDLSMFDRAIYYLTKARNLHLINPHQYYISCLRMLNDPEATTNLRKELQHVINHYSHLENSDQYYSYYIFLKCGLVEQLIDEHQIDDAAALLDSMSENEEEEEFVKEKREIICKLKELDKEEEPVYTKDSFTWPSKDNE